MKNTDRRAARLQPAAARAAARRRFCIAAPLAAAGLAGCALAGVDHAWWLAPLTATVGCAALWQLAVWLCFSRGERYLEQGFRRTLAAALACPGWTAMLMCALALFRGDAAENAGWWMFVIVALAVVTVLPPASLILGVWAVVRAARHLKAADPAAGRLYREMPLVLSIFLLAAQLTAGAMLALYLLA